MNRIRLEDFEAMFHDRNIPCEKVREMALKLVEVHREMKRRFDIVSEANARRIEEREE